MDIVEFFNPYSVEHLKAYEHLSTWKMAHRLHTEKFGIFERMSGRSG